MAKRPVFVCKDTYPYFESCEVEFIFYNGFDISQKQKSIKSLHDAFKLKNILSNPLEVSSKSTDILGVKLSAFNLTLIKNEKEYSVESLFQGSKVFEHGGPFTDIYDKTSHDAKKDERLKESGNIIGFSLFNEKISNEPKTFFYNWLYVNALNSHEEIKTEVLKYDAFTDIEFNPQKSLNCQAEAVAIYVSLAKAGLLKEALKSKEDFLRIVYGEVEKPEQFVQMSLFDLL